jgi:hypothetical protein
VGRRLVALGVVLLAIVGAGERTGAGGCDVDRIVRVRHLDAVRVVDVHGEVRERLAIGEERCPVGGEAQRVGVPGGVDLVFRDCVAGCVSGHRHEASRLERDVPGQVQPAGAAVRALVAPRAGAAGVVLIVAGALGGLEVWLPEGGGLTRERLRAE